MESLAFDFFNINASSQQHRRLQYCNSCQKHLLRVSHTVMGARKVNMMLLFNVGNTHSEVFSVIILKSEVHQAHGGAPVKAALLLS